MLIIHTITLHTATQHLPFSTGQLKELYFKFLLKDYNNRMQGGFGKIYKQVGVEKYYEKNGDQYSNPHKFDIQRLLKKKLSNNNFLRKEDSILDLACGSGEVTLILQQMGYKNICGIDPYTHAKYEQMTGLKCRELTFVDVVNGGLDQERYDAIIISYALHLVKESMLYSFCYKLAQIGKKLIIISPHKFPLMEEHFGWKEEQHSVVERIHFRVYNSFQYLQTVQQY